MVTLPPYSNVILYFFFSSKNVLWLELRFLGVSVLFSFAALCVHGTARLAWKLQGRNS